MCLHSAAIPPAMCSVCTPVMHATVAVKRQPRRSDYVIPTWSQWQRFKQSKPLPHQSLCIMCKQPVSKLTADTIRIGCRVRVAETDVFTVCNVDYKQITCKVIPLVLTGLGCTICQHLYTKAQAAELGRYQQADANYSRDLADPRKRPLLMQYGSTGPSKRQAVIDVSELVSEMDRIPMRPL